MSTGIEWEARINSWREELFRHIYRPIGTLDVKGFTTKEQLSVKEASKRNFASTPPGTEWGAKWEYAWFRFEIRVPAEAKGKRVVFSPDIGDTESAVYVNGTNAGARDAFHPYITLAMEGRPGETYDVMLEAYAGHGVRAWNIGPTPPDRLTVPEPASTQVVTGTSTFGVWEEDVYQLWIDAQMLKELSEILDSESLRVAEINQALRDFTLIADFEQPHEAMLASLRECRDRFRPLFQCVNGTTSPTVYAFGHSHIDVAWLWPLRETEAKATRTFATQMSLMDEYPEYRMLVSQPHLYRMMKDHYPELYARMKDKALAGQIMPEGGMWVEADTNITGGESLIRQLVHGKKFFMDEFGVESRLLWLPDVFGYSGALPQILRGCGVDYFSTAKINWNYHGADPFPYTTFLWEGIDGTEILTSLCNDYNSHANPTNVLLRWTERKQKVGLRTRLMPFGYGDGGGGATRDHLEYLRRSRDLEGLPRVTIANPIEFFEDLEKNGYPDDRYVGELYFQAHRGVWTSQARAKRGNRKSEIALREAEMWAVAASVLKGFEVPADELDTAWKQVMLNQFHDILPGSSIHRVYEEAEAGYAEAIGLASAITEKAAAKLVDRDVSAFTVLNSLSWPRKDLVLLPETMTGAVGYTGELLPVQEIAGKRFAEVEVPACGWTSVRKAEARLEIEESVSASKQHLENNYLRVEFGDKGEITSIFDKERHMELTTSPCNTFLMFKDVPSEFDAWDIDSQYALCPVELCEKASVEEVTSGPLRASIRMKRKVNNSFVTQEICLRRNGRRLDFVTTVDWRERHKLLKVSFPVNIHANEALHEIQFGHIARPNHYSRHFDGDRFEVCNQKWTALVEGNRGCAVLNDCKYGVNVLGNSINLTLLRSTLGPDMTADQGMHQFTYAFYAWNGSLAESRLVQEGYELNTPVTITSGFAGEKSLFSIDAPNIIVETVKPAEDRSGDIIVRLYESVRACTNCAMTTSFPLREVYETNMMESCLSPLGILGDAVVLSFRPFEIKTLRLSVVDSRDV